jgi:ABC-type uncharacterized transport system involved in gliding motility auxiliary subunit
MKQILSNLNSFAAVVLAGVLVMMIGYVALRNPIRFDLSERSYYQLSEKTLNLLEALEQEVNVTVFFQEEHDLYFDIENLLEEYQYHNRNIRVEWVDPARDPARMEKLVNQYGLTEAQVVVFDIGGRSKIKRQGDLADIAVVEGRKEPVMTAFKGEQAFSSAIQELLQDETPVVYFLVGHGEKRVTDFDPLSGLSGIRDIALRDNVNIEELILSGESRVPDDAAALIIAGPESKMSTVEAEMIENYLNHSGHVMIMLDALKETGLEDLLRRWGVALREDVVVDPENTLKGSDVHIRRYNVHPISIRMQSITQFILPRSIEPLVAEQESGADEDRPTVVPLFYTSEESWSETQFEAATARYDEDTGDRQGPVSLAVAIERGPTQQMLDVQIQPSRMVVFGDSDFVSNGNMVGGNADLFMNALNWLLDREELMAIAPKPIEEVRLSLSTKQLSQLFWINVAGVPLIAVVIGFIVWLRRRK